MHETSWLDQWQRIGRWRGRVQRNRDELQDSPEGPEGYRDDALALFQALWHLKDWFRNDSGSKLSGGSAVEDWVKEVSAHHLQIAADVANGSKHMKLTREPRSSGSQHRRTTMEVVVGVGSKATSLSRTCAKEAKSTRP